ncbi:2-oxoglutarate dehydrogenase E1 component [hydrothermal vent metagenome]|uniref:oxoglutarate dehydrogenase (succinyl-transferring) n=1 Tax=hydrothermal vent metagenome TaxID=652676 RepID=A0A3B1A3I9_9ZZZZ
MDLSNKKKSLQEIWNNSALAGLNSGYLEELYQQFLIEPESLDTQWRTYFTRMQNSTNEDLLHHNIKQEFIAHFKHEPQRQNKASSSTGFELQQIKVLQFINAYRFLGHRIANTNPFSQQNENTVEELTLDYYGFSQNTLAQVFETGSLFGVERLKLREIIKILQATYSGSLGAEYMHLSNIQEKRWLQQKLESCQGNFLFDKATKVELLKNLIAAEGLEHYLHAKYVGQKRFSLEGSESLIPLLKGLIKRGGTEHHIEEMAIGMAHRGRINVLINIMGKIPSDLFMEFEGKTTNKNGTGDVKYHMGFSTDLETGNGPVHVALAFNPSHLEIIAPVVEGSVRARQDRRGDKQGKHVIPIVIHGDAAFAGQGVVMETFNMSQSRGYSTKGTIHIVVNNQIGFTTSKQEDARSTMYCTDVAKMVDAPILHVNGDDPEAVLHTIHLALDYKMKFSKDIVIDMVCYRRHGHSEADEPMVTQPQMYKTIRNKITTLALYADKLISEGIITEKKLIKYKVEYTDNLDTGKSMVEKHVYDNNIAYPYISDWSKYVKCGVNFPFDNDVETQVDKTTLHYCYKCINNIPDGFELHRNVKKILSSRDNMANGTILVDWGFAETMAYATLLNDGFSIRLSGQDSGRGTFFHRHAILHNQKDTSVHIPLRNLNSDDVTFLVSNSLLSEEAVLAFEYGYATTDPKTMVIWEAQFGDFANNAQVVIDQFISAGEQKWNRLCGLVMLLPHGFEGQGPEHSSARLERYLQLCAQHNIQVCVPSNAAQIFHLLRRQMLLSCRRPLIIMSPKSLLRLPAAMSDFKSLSNGKFETLIVETEPHDSSNITRVIFCSGKIYYALQNSRKKNSKENIIILRIEQLYPFPTELVADELKKYTNVTDYVWCQEEPMNQGAWYSSQHHIRHAIGKNKNLEYAGRPLLAAPAVGNINIHKEQEAQLISDALGF